MIHPHGDAARLVAATLMVFALSAAARAFHPDWQPPAVVDSAGDAGKYASLDWNPTTARPGVSYLSDADNGTLKVAEFDGFAWQVSPVATNVGLTDVFTSLRYIEGEPAVAYYDYERGRLRYAQRAAGVWQIVTIDGADAGPPTNIGAYCSLLILPDGRPAVSYIDRGGAGALKYAERTAGVWSVQSIPNAAADVRGWTSLQAQPNGQPAISFVMGAKLRYAFFNGANWVVSANLDSVGDIRSTSLAFVAGNPVIAYFDDANNTLRFARYTGGNIALPTGWARSTADGGGVGGFVDAEIAVDGLPVIAYYSAGSAADGADAGGVRLARADNPANPSWLRQTVDDPAPRGRFASFAFVDAVASLAYYDQPSGDLLFTQLAIDANGNGIPDGIEPPPAPTGACCQGAACSLITEAECVAAQGSYLGDGSTCDGDPCAAPTGACCGGDECTVVTATDCQTASGLYLGDGTTCNGDPCSGATGACCLGVMCESATPIACLLLGGFYVGDGVSCFPIADSENICEGPIGACCLGEDCLQLAADACFAANGQFVGIGAACNPDTCGGPTGACCVGESCLEITAAACGQVLGQHLGDGVSCNLLADGGIVCEGPVGACCLGENCVQISEDACDAASGVFVGVGVNCDQSTCAPPSGACCSGVSCFQSTAAGCTFPNVYLGDGVGCGDSDGVPANPCAGATGACCIGGACIQVTASVCAAASGAYSGDGVPCPSGEACPGDMDCDGAISFADIDPFVLAIGGQAGYEAQFPCCRYLNGDTNGDQLVNFADIDMFVGLIGSACANP